MSTWRSVAIGAAMACASGCYASHGPASVRVDGVLIEDGWIEGDVGDARGVAEMSYEIQAIDRRDGDPPWLAVHLHTGAIGGAPFPWVMAGIGFRLVSLDELEPGYRWSSEESSEPGVELWACAGPEHGAQVFEEAAVILDVEVRGVPERREILFEAELEGGQHVRGGFTATRSR